MILFRIRNSPSSSLQGREGRSSSPGPPENTATASPAWKSHVATLWTGSHGPVRSSANLQPNPKEEPRLDSCPNLFPIPCLLPRNLWHALPGYVAGRFSAALPPRRAPPSRFACGTLPASQPAIYTLPRASPGQSRRGRQHVVAAAAPPSFAFPPPLAAPLPPPELRAKAPEPLPGPERTGSFPHAGFSCFRKGRQPPLVQAKDAERKRRRDPCAGKGPFPSAFFFCPALPCRELHGPERQEDLSGAPGGSSGCKLTLLFF